MLSRLGEFPSLSAPIVLQTAPILQVGCETWVASTYWLSERTDHRPAARCTTPWMYSILAITGGAITKG